jgi:hypothetical protein
MHRDDSGGGGGGGGCEACEGGAGGGGGQGAAGGSSAAAAAGQWAAGFGPNSPRLLSPREYPKLALERVRTRRMCGADIAPQNTSMQWTDFGDGGGAVGDEAHALCEQCGLGGDLLMCDGVVGEGAYCPIVFHVQVGVGSRRARCSEEGRGAQWLRFVAPEGVASGWQGV